MMHLCALPYFDYEKKVSRTVDTNTENSKYFEQAAFHHAKRIYRLIEGSRKPPDAVPVIYKRGDELVLKSAIMTNPEEKREHFFVSDAG